MKEPISIEKRLYRKIQAFLFCEPEGIRTLSYNALIASNL